MGNEIVGLVIVIVGVLLYFLPTIVGSKRKHKNQNPIALANLFFGWTLIGWVICLIWSASDHVQLKAGLSVEDQAT